MISAFFSSWNSADWINIILTSILFFAGIVVTKIINTKQECTIKEIHDLQEANAELQIREKIGVIAGKINAIEHGKKKNSSELMRFAMNVNQDGLSVLPLYRFASERLQIEYRDTLAHALRVLNHPYYEIQLESMYSHIGEHINKLEEEGLSCASILRGAIQQTNYGIHSTNKKYSSMGWK